MILAMLETRSYQSGQQDTFKARHHQDIETNFKESSQSSSSNYIEANKYSTLCYKGTVFLVSESFTLYFRGTDLSASSSADSHL